MSIQPAGMPIADPGRCLVMGILNVTPDSFSDGGRYVDSATAVAAGIALQAGGADIVDVGGESTRPGADRVSLAEERRRVLPVVEALAAAGVPVSVDTMRAEIASECVSAGAVMVNDVSGGLADPEMLATVAQLSVPYVVMHWRAHGDRMDQQATYNDVVTEVREELLTRLAACAEAGIRGDRLIIDPGLGFAKQPEHNWSLLRQLDAFIGMGYPLLLGASRKRFLGSLLAHAQQPRDIAGRAAATVAMSSLAAAAGVWAVRVHDVRENADAVRVAAAWYGGAP